ncbi:hypothetical protein QBC44DRAFT_333392 [Cladorrhinum sp. PSN332]|nr:hypothetical protein QBC44DRAFT_333392 [Cladorrhinum sp. PSN332]
MQFFSVLAMALMPFFAPALAAPAGEAAPAVRDVQPPFAPAVGPPINGTEAQALAKRDTPGVVYICTGPNWQGTCQTFYLGTSGTCYSIPAPYQYNAGSVGPDAGAICRLFDNAHSTCAGSGLAILQKPGSSNLFTPHDFPGYNAAYWKCNACSACT